MQHPCNSPKTMQIASNPDGSVRSRGRPYPSLPPSLSLALSLPLSLWPSPSLSPLLMSQELMLLNKVECHQGNSKGSGQFSQSPRESYIRA